MKSLLIVSMFLSQISSFSKSPLNDMIYLTESDSIVCRLVFSNERNNAMYIHFIDADGSKIKKTANEIIGYRTSKGELFRSLRIEVSGQKKQYICHVINSGYALLYSTYIEDLGSVRYLVINNSDPVQIKNGKEIHVLSFLFRDCGKMTQSYIESKKPGNIENLAKLVVEYNNCIDPETDSRIVTNWPGNQVEISPGLVLGYEHASLTSDQNDENFGNDNTVVVGANCEFIFSDKFAIVPAMIYSNTSYYHAAPYILYPHLTLYQDFKFARVEGEIGLKYYLNKRGVRPYFSVSPVFSLFSDINLKRKVQGDDGYELPISNTDEDYYSVGVRGSIGVKFNTHKLKPFAELRYSNEKVAPKIANSQDTFSLRALQVILGIAF